MKRCTTVCSGRFRVAGFANQPRRWVSYDKSALTKEALLQQAESQLGHDVDGNPLRIDPDAKTVTTAVGSLPISPIMDPAWMKAGRREKKRDPGMISGQFRKKLSNNPFAMALMTPPRRCTNTESYLPRYFLQDFELVQHPEKTAQPWWTPGPSTFDSIVPVYNPGPYSPTSHTKAQEDQSGNAEVDQIPANIPNENGVYTTATESSIVKPSTVDGQPTEVESRHHAPITTYCLSRKSVLQAISEGTGEKVPGRKKPNRNLINKLLAVRNGMAASNVKFNNTVWRSDMADFVLNHQRRTVVDALIHRANRSNSPDSRFLQSVATWDEVKTVDNRGCVLWLSDKVDPVADSFATLDVENVKYWNKMPVHNLTWLLGEEEVQRLRESSEVFRDNQLVVLKLWKSESMRKLHLLLWRLQGYQAQMKRSDKDDKDKL
ncbi:hypothetical protein G7Z17_g5254 [Cylindrodendrum hubeiense]|uniref:Uncharacterized protein n=1 Tax=Cylindrodendrum hubeiense TaxID=595255 RepID=A0A9P5HF83_9HYPO|nr:hypothetical protein G7Z17_g5254 [Cylindrodendrum hubeiense]